jgi:hypothetical protein
MQKRRKEEEEKKERAVEWRGKGSLLLLFTAMEGREKEREKRKGERERQKEERKREEEGSHHKLPLGVGRAEQPLHARRQK